MIENDKNETKFDYTYSAPTENERREIESIRKRYTPPQENESKLEELRRLNNRVIRPPMIIGWIIGIFGTLIFGAGMTMVLEWDIKIWGIIVGIIGVAIAAVAYPIYKAVLKRNKRKYGQQIIDLSNDLLNIAENETD
ncbi:MAG: hypothetical protein K2G44_04485 [Clostridia bacterium]|nr:hypothetical protein [Clostridia bacterium]